MSQVFYLRAHTASSPISISIEKSSGLQGYGTIEAAVNALAVPTYDYTHPNMFGLNRAMNQIAINSRRGVGNTVFSPVAIDVPENVRLIVLPGFKRIVLCYQGTIESDRTIIYQDGTYYIHPDASKLAFELIV